MLRCFLKSYSTHNDAKQRYSSYSMNELIITNSLEGTPLTISATSMLSLDGMGTGAIRSSVFEINNSSSNVNFISHVWLWLLVVPTFSSLKRPAAQKVVKGRRVNHYCLDFLRPNNRSFLFKEIYTRYS